MNNKVVEYVFGSESNALKGMLSIVIYLFAYIILADLYPNSRYLGILPTIIVLGVSVLYYLLKVTLYQRNRSNIMNLVALSTLFMISIIVAFVCNGRN
ncbi:hypothetical protein [Lentibacillus sp. Marseille-P4043]|uniref:hypothetical protein n=1 Tax=Lentibacillus sp. Marseille-P4043 TaxID=2040293 RepID=UPI000D0AE4C8|nr:hypothetical protein [Lentibacillus sp. Marseille-P4043]